MTDAKIRNKLPRTVRLLLPDSYKVTIRRSLLVTDIFFEFPWSSGEAHIARRSDNCIRRLPGEQRPLIGRRNRMFAQPLLPIDSARTKQQSIIRNKRHECIANVLLRSHFRKRLLSLDHLLKRRLPPHRYSSKHANDHHNDNSHNPFIRVNPRPQLPFVTRSLESIHESI